ncbi:MAG: hypothetical protein HGA45_20730 [Chloroflexales bacterium]|nr:hypothetical protein [Chloroflexales bacterium]
MTQVQLVPKREIRRFDIFAEWNRLKGRNKAKLNEDDARAYGLAVAKVVAARKFSGHDPAQAKELKRKAKEEEVGEPWWEHLGSGEEFARTVVARMGEAFYREVFQPAVLKAWEDGQRYEEIRDALREPWNRQLQKGAEGASGKRRGS